MTKAVGILFAATTLVACASTKDVDISHVDADCGHSCAVNYQECTNRPGFILFPIEVHNQCVGALRLCASACPVRNGAGPAANP
jgi:hypothetical protein